MSIPVGNLNSLTKANLVALVENGATESLTLEFKRETYGNKEADKKELLKDVTAFANSIGGDLILGVEEQNGVATRLAPLTCNTEPEIDRLYQILRSGVEPALSGVSIVPVQADKGACIVLRIPRSPRAPHRVSAYGSSRFHVRHGKSAVEATIDELRHLFARQREMNERAQDFHLRTIEHIQSGTPPSRPRGVDETFILLQLFPLQTLIDADRAIDLSNPKFLDLPLYGAPMGRSTLYSFDGVFNYESDSPRRARTLSVIYRSGVLEFCEYGVLGKGDGQPVFPPSHVPDIMAAVRDGCSFLANAGLADDAFAFCSIVNCEGARLVLGKSIWSGAVNDWEIIDRPMLTLPSAYLESISDGDKVMRRLRPMLDALWNAAGRAHCPHYDSDGKWTAPPN